MAELEIRSESRYVSTDLLIDPQSSSGVSWDLWKEIEFPVKQDDVTQVIEQGQGYRLDQLANRYYNNPRYWWVLAAANNLLIPDEELTPGTVIRVPSLSTIGLVLEGLRQ